MSFNPPRYDAEDPLQSDIPERVFARTNQAADTAREAYLNQKASEYLDAIDVAQKACTALAALEELEPNTLDNQLLLARAWSDWNAAKAAMRLLKAVLIDDVNLQKRVNSLLLTRSDGDEKLKHIARQNMIQAERAKTYEYRKPRSHSKKEAPQCLS